MAASFDDLCKLHPNWVLALAVCGLFGAARFLSHFLRVVYENHFMRGINLKKYATGSTYAVITGATDGIGKEFALQLAKIGFNLVIVSRTPAKLSATADEITSAYPNVTVKTFALDFSQAQSADYAALKKALDGLNIYMLVNNVGVSHSLPTPFVEESMDMISAIVEVNINSVLKLTHMVLPGMLERKTGLVLNVGSFAGLVPTPFLQVYSGTKSFLKLWSESLSAEVKPFGVHVELLNTFFVVSNMSKIRKSSAVVPTAALYVRSVLKRVGCKIFSTPYPVHNLLCWAAQTFVPPSVLLQKVYDMFYAEMQKATRKRALGKQQKSK